MLQVENGYRHVEVAPSRVGYRQMRDASVSDGGALTLGRLAVSVLA
jgi:hypothetical protein